MKIIVIGHGNLFDNYGGGQVYVINLIAGMIGKGHDVVYQSIAFSNCDFSHLRKKTVNGIVTRLLVLPDLWSGVDSDQYEMAVRALASSYQDNSTDIVHAHAWKDLACLAADRAGMPCVVTAHHGGIVCPAGALLNHKDEICSVPAGQNTCLSCCVRSVRGGKLWLPLLRFFPLGVQFRIGRWLRERRFIYFATALGTLSLSTRDKLASIEILGKYASLLIAPSQAIRDALVRNGISASKVVVVPHGIPLPQRRPLRANLHKSPVRFLFIGRNSYVKGVHVMLEAFSTLPNETYELRIVGGAATKSEQRYLARLRRKYASVNAVWLGSKSHEGVPRHIAACDVIVHPTICLEVFGLTIAEALAVGRPVIASRCGGAEAQIRDGDNGMLVPPNDAIALRRAVQSVIDDPECIQTMATQTNGVVPIERHVGALETIYAEALKKR